VTGFRGRRAAAIALACALGMLGQAGCEADQPKEGGLFVMNRDGSDLHKATEIQAGGGTWSPDGTRLLFGTQITESGQLGLASPTRGGALLIVNADSGASRDIRIAAYPTDLFWSADDTIHFTMRHLPKRRGTWIASVPGGGGVVTKAPLGLSIKESDWSTDGGRLTFSATPRRHRSASRNLWVADARGENVRSLVRAPGNVQRPTFSPDGRRIAYVVAQGKRQSVWSVRSNGARPRQLRANIDAGALDWSPNSKELLVAGHRRVDRLSADGSAVEPVGATSPVKPGWSPDGRTIAVIRQEGANPLDSFVLLPVGGGEEEAVITLDGLQIGGFQWSPDGERIFFGASALPEVEP
jgi:Tol biopolymer transport system component